MHRLRIGCHVVPQYAPQFAAEALGAFARRDLDVEFASTRLGFGAVEALFNNETDLMLGNGLYATLCRGTSREMVVVADLVERSYLVLATTAPGVVTAELKGKLLLVPGTNPATWVALTGLVRRSGVASSDVRLLPCLSIEDAIDLQRVGVGDLVLLPFEAAVRADLNVAVSLADALGTAPWSVYQVAAHRQSQLASHIDAFRDGLSEGLTWCAEHSASEIAALLASRFAAEPREVEHLIDSYKRHAVWAASTGPNLDVLQRWQTTTRDAGLLYSS